MRIKRKIFVSIATLALLSIGSAFENCSPSGHSLNINTGSSSLPSVTSTSSPAPGASPHSSPVATTTPTPTPPPDATTLVWAHFTFPFVYYSGVSGCPGVLSTMYASSAACTTDKLCQLGIYTSGSPLLGGTFIIESLAQACVQYDTVKKCIPPTEVPPIVLDPAKEAMNPTITYPTTQPVLILDTSTGLKICP